MFHIIELSGINLHALRGLKHWSVNLNKKKKNMDDFVLNPLLLALLCVLLYGALKGFNSLWWKPKWLQRKLKQQGIMGTPYRPLIGDMKVFVKLISEAWSKPMNLNHKIVSRVDPFTLHTHHKYGNFSASTYLVILVWPNYTNPCSSLAKLHLATL